MTIITTETHECKRVLRLNEGDIERILLNHMLKLAGMPPLEEEKNRMHYELDWHAPSPDGEVGHVFITITQPLDGQKKATGPVRRAAGLAWGRGTSGWGNSA